MKTTSTPLRPRFRPFNPAERRLLSLREERRSPIHIIGLRLRTIIVMAGAIALVWSGVAWASSYGDTDTHISTPISVTATPAYDSFNQANFPCKEDEGLMYGPEFGPDRVGCVNVGDWRK